MKTKGYWIIKTSAGGYWCSGGFDPQIRKAHVYTWKEKAEETIESFIRRRYFPAEVTYEVVAIAEPKELKDTQAEWKVSGMFDDFLKCSNCGESWPWQTAAEFNFCPKCGKLMINSTMPEDD